MPTLTATEFKAKCLALLDRVAKTGNSLTITKRGRPVAQVLPALPPKGKYPQDALRGSGRILGDIVSPILWRARQRTGVRRRGR